MAVNGEERKQTDPVNQVFDLVNGMECHEMNERKGC